MTKVFIPRKRTARTVTLVVLVVGLVAIGVVAWVERHRIEQVYRQATLPTAVPYSPTPTPTRVATSPATPSHAPSPTPTTAPQEANLAVPFTAQAPHANWDDPYGEFCEEASVLMAMSYLTNKPIPNTDFADQELLKIQAFEEKTFGYYKDTTAEETARIIREYYKYSKVEVKQNPTVDDIKKAVSDGRVVIVPLAGQEIGNPYFQQPGPLYHMLVIKGYTDDGNFITNDPGTKRGADFIYSQETIMNAIHDWRTDHNIDLGKKVVIIAG